MLYTNAQFVMLVSINSLPALCALWPGISGLCSIEALILLQGRNTYV